MDRSDAFDYLYERRGTDPRIANRKLIDKMLDEKIRSFDKNRDGRHWYSFDDLRKFLSAEQDMHAITRRVLGLLPSERTSLRPLSKELWSHRDVDDIEEAARFLSPAASQKAKEAAKQLTQIENHAEGRLMFESDERELFSSAVKAAKATLSELNVTA